MTNRQRFLAHGEALYRERQRGGDHMTANERDDLARHMKFEHGMHPRSNAYVNRVDHQVDHDRAWADGRTWEHPVTDYRVAADDTPEEGAR